MWVWVCVCSDVQVMEDKPDPKNRGKLITEHSPRAISVSTHSFLTGQRKRLIGVCRLLRRWARFCRPKSWKRS